MRVYRIVRAAVVLGAVLGMALAPAAAFNVVKFARPQAATDAPPVLNPVEAATSDLAQLAAEVESATLTENHARKLEDLMQRAETWLAKAGRRLDRGEPLEAFEDAAKAAKRILAARERLEMARAGEED